MRVATLIVASSLLLTVAFAQRTASDAQQVLQPQKGQNIEKFLEFNPYEVFGDPQDPSLQLILGWNPEEADELVVMNRNFLDMLAHTMDREDVERNHAEN